MVKFLGSVIYLQAAAGLRMHHEKDDSIRNSPYCPESLSFTSKLQQPDSAVVTYAGIDKQPYIDGAIMIGRALAPNFPSMHFECLVGSTMSTTNKELLRNAGWNVREVDLWCPEKKLYGNQGYWTQSYEKINAFRLPFQKVLFLDADTYVFSNDAASKVLDQLRAFGQPGGVPSDRILMAHDVNPDNGYNSGMMIFSPSEAKFEQITRLMDNGDLDQPAINKAFDEKIQELSPDYNTHGWMKNCDTAIVAHFTGSHKPAMADAKNLQEVRSGCGSSIPFHGMLACPQLYHEYFRRLQTEKKYLTPALAKLLD
jgi:hypothetical protein